MAVLSHGLTSESLITVSPIYTMWPLNWLTRCRVLVHDKDETIHLCNLLNDYYVVLVILNPSLIDYPLVVTVIKEVIIQNDKKLFSRTCCFVCYSYRKNCQGYWFLNWITAKWRMLTRASSKICLLYPHCPPLLCITFKSA